MYHLWYICSLSTKDSIPICSLSAKDPIPSLSILLDKIGVVVGTIQQIENEKTLIRCHLFFKNLSNSFTRKYITKGQTAI